MSDSVNTQITSLEKLLNMNQTADFLGVSKFTLYSWISQKKIKVVKIGSRSMFRPSDICDFIRNHVVETKKRTPEENNPK